MSPLFAHFQFGRPEFFFLLLVLPALWLRRREFSPALLGRALALLLVIAALAEPRIVETAPPAKAAGRVFAFDLSRSVPAEMRLWMARQDLVPRAGDRVFVFGGAAEEAGDWERRLKSPAPAVGIRPERTNLEALFSQLLKLPRAERSVYLFTDGWENEGSAERLLPALAQAGVRVYPVLPPEPPAVANVAVKKVVVPGTATKGEAVGLKVMVENGGRGDVEGDLVIKRNGRPVKNETARLRPGSQLLTYQVALGDGPLQSFSVEFTPRRGGADLLPEDNRATGWVGVESREKALLINGRSGEGRYLEELLKRRGFDATAVAAGGAPPPAGYGLVVLNNVEKDRLPPAYLAALERHVSGGGGLVMLGDNGGLTPAYRQSPLAAALPVEFREPKEKEPQKTRAVVLVVDKSSSMDPRNNPYREDRIPYAKEIAKKVITQLGDDDFIGVIEFNDKPLTLAPLDSVKKLRPTFNAEIDRLAAKGNTDVIVALREAARQLQRQTADVKHIILVTDADFIGGGPAPGQYIDLVTSMKNADKISVSAVGVGHGVDRALIKRLAAYGGGVEYIAEDLSHLPEIVFKHIGQKPEPQPRPPLDYAPVAASDSEILNGFAERYPPVKGYVESEPKKEARLDLTIRNDGRNWPLLASWKHGKGKAAVLTIDQAGRWSRDWVPWNGLERFWGRVLGWAGREREALPPYDARVDLADGRPVLDFYLYGAESDGNPFRYSFSGPKGARGDGALKRLAPGRYQADLPFAAPGDYRIDLKEERRGLAVAYPPLGYTLRAVDNNAAEVARPEFNLPLLERVAEATGGEMNPGAVEERRPEAAAPAARPLRAYLILAAALLFLLEVFFRRLYLGEA